MATHPYISGPGNISQMVMQLRKAFPSVVDADTVKKLGLASNNESYVINVLQFIGVLDDQNKKTSVASKVFSLHKDEEFYKEFSSLVKNAYKSLFELHGDAAWLLSSDALITFFRTSDQTSEAIGKRQAGTFKVLASLCGHGDDDAKMKKAATPKDFSKQLKSQVRKESKPAVRVSDSGKTQVDAGGQREGDKNIGLTVRVEINLPAGGTKETYDNIFKSIKENLLGG